MNDKIETVSRVCAVIRKLNFPVLRADIALAGEISGMCDSKNSFSIACKKNLGALTVAVFIILIAVIFIVKHTKKDK